MSEEQAMQAAVEAGYLDTEAGIRGAISSLNQMMIVLGILAAFIVNAILASSGDWRLMLGLAAVPSLILLFGLGLAVADALHPNHSGKGHGPT